MKQTLPGVYQAVKKDQTVYYRASVTYRGKHISLGSFEDMESAHRAYLEALELTAPASRPAPGLHDYDGSRHLRFEKWVVLINFRDNRIYFPTPIYVYRKFFMYYLSPDFSLKFDLDDLFYYSNKKIMRRKGHFFVSDYGMQYNIMNRYGIKNYAVEGRDYRFVNGDRTDLRYENIEILNSYHGVTALTKHGEVRYKAKIHIRGDYVIGTYDTAEEAAIAYNKAADILRRNGFAKNFALNYLESIPPSRYAQIYTALPVSGKILSCRPDGRQD